MIYNEDDIREQLSSQSANVDTNQLWNDIRHHAPIQKPSRWLLFLIFFALGGLISATISYFYLQTPCISDKYSWTTTKDSLTQENSRLQQKLNASIEEIAKLKNEIKNVLQMEYYTNKLPINKSNHPIIKTSALVKNISENAINQNHNLLLTETNSSSTSIDQQNPNPFINIKPISSTLTYPTIEQKDDIKIDNPIVHVIIPNRVAYPLQYYIGMTSGIAYVTDHQVNNEGNSIRNSFTPHISYTAEVGLIKRTEGRFSFGALVNYSNMIYRLNYQNRLVENISLIDTTEIFIANNGSQIISIGNTGGVNITEQKGKIHGYKHRISIIPTIHYQSFMSNKFILDHQIGLGLDVMNVSRDIIPSYDERSFITQQVSKMAFNPFLRIGTQLEYFISKDLSAALFLQCTYRNENYNFSLYRGTRSALFPSIGLGLLFN
ncbi:MAG TPA: hypothetical protein PKD51_17305 [Saprospiraceae bacterium]|nr:hypothetical protein [Saprospiraceae bacterium]